MLQIFNSATALFTQRRTHAGVREVTSADQTSRARRMFRGKHARGMNRAFIAVLRSITTAAEFRVRSTINLFVVLPLVRNAFGNAFVSNCRTRTTHFLEQARSKNRATRDTAFSPAVRANHRKSTPTNVETVTRRLTIASVLDEVRTHSNVLDDL